MLAPFVFINVGTFDVSDARLATFESKMHPIYADPIDP